MTPIKAVLFDWGETLVRIPGMIHSPERHLGCLKRLFEECGGENGGPDLRALGVSWPSLRTVDGADEVTEELARHVRLAIVSNYPHAPVVYGTLERLGLRRHFCAVVVSSELGWLKPHPELYRTALTRIGARAEETVFVGDNLDNDIRAPKALGLRTAWLTTEPSKQPPEADITLSDLRQLTAWCNLPSEGRRERER